MFAYTFFFSRECDAVEFVFFHCLLDDSTRLLALSITLPHWCSNVAPCAPGHVWLAARKEHPRSSFLHGGVDVERDFSPGCSGHSLVKDHDLTRLNNEIWNMSFQGNIPCPWILASRKILYTKTPGMLGHWLVDIYVSFGHSVDDIVKEHNKHLPSEQPPSWTWNEHIFFGFNPETSSCSLHNDGWILVVNSLMRQNEALSHSTSAHFWGWCWNGQQRLYQIWDAKANGTLKGVRWKNWLEEIRVFFCFFGVGGYQFMLTFGFPSWIDTVTNLQVYPVGSLFASKTWLRFLSI